MRVRNGTPGRRSQQTAACSALVQREMQDRSGSACAFEGALRRIARRAAHRVDALDLRDVGDRQSPGTIGASDDRFTRNVDEVKVERVVEEELRVGTTRRWRTLRLVVPIS